MFGLEFALPSNEYCLTATRFDCQFCSRTVKIDDVVSN